MKSTAIRIVVTLAAAAAFTATGAAQEVHEAITVERLIVDAHITRPDGEPIPYLTAEDLEVWINGVRVEIEGVDWFPEEGSFVDPKTGARVTAVSDSRRGRLLVLFFQTDFARVRARGQMRMIEHAKRFIETLTPDDLVAVVQHDSKLKLIEDFTSDHDRLREAIDRSIRIEDVFWRDDGRRPSIARYLSVEKASKASTPERALRYLGEALQPTDGIKSIVMFGWGLGVYGSGGVQFREFVPTQMALEVARASVFALDVSIADWHTLEVGLQKMAEDTGGFYEKTHIFPTMAIEKLRRTLSGRYEIVLFKPDDLPARFKHKVEIKVMDRSDAIVLARGTWIEK